jgi:hypothetical protein
MIIAFASKNNAMAKHLTYLSRNSEKDPLDSDDREVCWEGFIMFSKQIITVF